VPPLARSTAIMVEQPIGGAMVLRQWHGPSARRDVEATYAADVFSDVLNEPGSRFQRRLVESGLFSTLRVNYYTLAHTGPITIFGETRPEQLRAAMRALDEELQRIVDDPTYFDQALFESVKRQRVAGTMFSLERASGFAHQLGFWWSVTGLDYFLGYVDAMARQAPADLRRYAREYLVGKPHVTGVLLPTGAASALGITETELAR
jgi:zinc protease